MSILNSSSKDVSWTERGHGALSRANSLCLKMPSASCSSCFVQVENQGSSSDKFLTENKQSTSSATLQPAKKKHRLIHSKTHFNPQ